MGWYYHFKFFKEEVGKLDEKFIRDLIRNLESVGCKYYEPGEYYENGYWSNEKDDLIYERPLDEAIKVTHKQGGGYISMWYEDKISFSLSIHLNKLGMLEVGISVDSFHLSGEDEEENANILLNISEKLYDFLHPFYTYADHEYEGPEDEDLISKDISHIYWVNFFSPELVQKIGREKLLSAPSWKTKKLKDGGILLALGSSLYELKVEKEEVEKYIGFR